MRFFDAPLPGGDIPDADFDAWLGRFQAAHPWLPADLARHYGRCFGTEAEMLLANAGSIADLGRHFGGLFYEREAQWLMDHEWARTADDILTRRTKHGLFLTKGEKSAFEDWMRRSVAAA